MRETSKRPSIRSAARSASAWTPRSREGWYRARVARVPRVRGVHVRTRSPGTHAHASTNGDTENGWSGIEARLIVLDNSDASADATIPGRCWPGLADWLAGDSRGYISLSPSPCLLFLPFSLSFSLHPCHPADILVLSTLSFIVQPFPLFSHFCISRFSSSFFHCAIRFLRRRSVYPPVYF